MKSYRVRQETFIAQLHDGTFDAVSYEALRTQGSYLTQYTDQLTAAFLMEGREGYLVLGQRGTSQNMVFTIVAAIGSVLFVLRTQPAAAGTADEPRCTPRRGWRIRH